MEDLDDGEGFSARVVGFGAGGVNVVDEVRITREAAGRPFGAGGLASGK